MPNYKARSQWQLIENYKSLGTGTTKTFTFPAIDFTRISHLVLIVTGGTTAALELRLQFEGDTTSAYYYDGRRMVGGAETLLAVDAEEYLVLLSAILNDAANRANFIEAHITIPTTGLQYPSASIHSSCSGATGGNEETQGFLAVGKSSLSNITISVSTSSWLDGFQMTLYKVGK